jgi:hypothetical protein
VYFVVVMPGVFVPQRRVRTIVLMDEMLVCEDNSVYPSDFREAVASTRPK